MLFRPSTKTKFRNAAFGIGVATLAAVSSFPVNAQQAVNYSAPADCTTVVEPGKRAICESIKRTENANAQVQSEAALKKCLGQIAGFKKAQPGEFAKLGSITRDNACEIATKLPRASASLN
jgi:hypothetical protein